MSSDIAISVKNLTKTYRLFNHPGDRIKQALTFGRIKFHKEFTALKDVSFEVKKGETIGIIGQNGSGKSTLLQLICGILKPTSGSVTVNGRISALLELGSGFNPEFTGRENIYFQGAIMGFSQAEMNAQVEDIIAFADIGGFIDQPIRTYSSGMFVRLAFAVAINAAPDILVIDEALAVGDVGFQQKCQRYFEEVKEQGITLLLVSHDIQMIKATCNKAMYFGKGKLQIIGEPEIVTEHYLEDSISTSQHSERHQLAWDYTQRNVDFKEKIGQILSLGFRESTLSHAQFKSGERLVLYIEARVAKQIANPELVIQIRDWRGYALYGIRTQPSEVKQIIDGAWKLVTATLTFNADLGSGEYGIVAGLLERRGDTNYIVLDKILGAASFTIDSSDCRFHGPVDLHGTWDPIKETS